MEQIKPQDAQFLYTETDDNFNHITLLLNFDGASEKSGGALDFENEIIFPEKIKTSSCVLPSLGEITRRVRLSLLDRR